MTHTTENSERSLLIALLDCGWMDLDHFIENEMMQAEAYDFEMDDLIERVRDMGYEKIDINALIYVSMNAVFHKVTDSVLEAIENEEFDIEDEDITADMPEFKTWIEELKENFSPFCNCLDSWYSNCFDNMTLEGDKEQDFNELYAEFKNP